MKSKWKINFMLVLCTISLISIGFSSWTISAVDSLISINGSIETDTIINSNDYIRLNEDDLSIFTYTKLGFKDVNGNITNTGTITAPYIVDVAKCRDKFGQPNIDRFNIEVSLKYIPYLNTQDNLFINTDTLKFEVKIDDAIAIPTIDDNKSIVNIPMIDDGSKDTITFTIVYTFIIDLDYYKSNIFEILNNKNFDFILNAKLMID